MTRRTYQPHNRRHAKKYGFRNRTATRAGRTVISTRRRRDRKQLAIWVLLAKVNRLVKATEHCLVMRHGQRRTQGHFIGFQYWQDSSYPARIGLVVSKKLVRLVTRCNLVKRRLRGAVREHLGELPPGSLAVFLVRSAADKVAYRELDSQLESLIAGWQRPQQKN